MRVLQVVSLVSPKGEYGGPTRVALAQCRALREAGHDVVLAAGSWGYDAMPSEVEGVRVRLFRAVAPVPGSFHGLSSPGLVSFVARAARRADAVHVHLARDLVTLPAALATHLGRQPYVLQTHGMVVPSGNPLARPLDLTMTRRVLRGAGRVFYLTDAERRGLQEVASPLRLEHLRNGIDLPPATPLPSAAGSAPQVLFLARVQARKRPLDFVEMAVRLAPRYPEVVFRMVGPDEGLGQEVRDAISRSGLGDRLVWEGPLPPHQTSAAMRAADIYVLPSVDEPYPMTVLEAMSLGRPVVVTDSCGLAPIVERRAAGSVTPPGAAGVAMAVDRLLSDPSLRTQSGGNARAAIRDELGMEPVVAQLERSYNHLTRTS
ncbi:glycosyltransferase [Arsenicicoccus sp. MKL-02]|uniref:Glycosyltransferase n=1 Tax=Arsenicicoccus cauae TaxID=2663847 RepID=A0A6I3IG17_9MICO|nr:glycosyltransferase [Arsenicicoccus cauae]MTB72657.1 glycosyltransferase [Arsenicicoccus cauae]